MGKWFRSWKSQLLLAVVAVGVVLAAPLASSDAPGADSVIIAGARSLTDRVAVSYADAASVRTTDLHIMGFNDLHGNLETGGTQYGKYAGGAPYLAKVIKDRQAAYRRARTPQITVMAGDNIGASPLANGLFHEEPITIASNLMNVDLAAVGNHEFDKGAAELRRIQEGGCHADGCTGAPYARRNGRPTNRYPGADFQYLSTNVVVNATGETLFPAYAVKRFKSKSGRKFKIGFLGEVLESTPTIVTPTGVAGLTFQDEAEAANRVVQMADGRRGDDDDDDDDDDGGGGGNVGDVKTWVLVIHEGGFQAGAPALNGCAGNLAGSPIADIASRLDPRIKVIVSGHTHAEYRCTITIGGVTRLITSASSFGRILTDVTLKINDRTGELVEASAENVVVENAKNVPPATRVPEPALEDPAVAAVRDQYVTASAPLANRVIGRAQGDLTRTGTAFGESALGDVIADAQYEATKAATLGGAKFAFMNPGGIRGDLLANAISSGGEAVGEVTYGEAFTIQPFGNSLVTKTMTGDMIRRLLQQQFQGCGGTAPAGGRILQISWTFKYEQVPASTPAACTDRIGRMWVDQNADGDFADAGELIAATESLRVTMNNFLAFGGDGFTVFNEGTNALGGAQDIDAWVAYFQSKEPAGIAVPLLNRIVPKP